MSSVLHEDLTPDQGIHVPYSFTYADSAARTAATGFTADDLYKLALEEDTATLWMLTAVTPTWVEVAGSEVTLETELAANLLGMTGQELTLDTQAANLVFAGPATGAADYPSFRSLTIDDLPPLGTGDVTGPGSSTDNAIVRWDGVGGDTIKDSTAILNNDGSVEFTVDDAVTNAVSNALEISHNSSGTPAANFGVGIQAKAETDTTADTLIGGLGWSWSVVTHASRRSGLSFYGYYQANLKEVGRIEASTYASAAPNARGMGAVDFSAFRAASSYVASGQESTISGGGSHTASGYRSFIGGGAYNTASNNYATVAGGSANTASGLRSTASGGASNVASGDRATVSGGSQNTASGTVDTVGGGFNNQASGGSGTIGGGTGNTTGAGSDATVAGGNSNDASGQNSSITGGSNNTAGGAGASILGGSGNYASGAYSATVGGSTASARLEGQVVSANGQFAALGDAQGVIHTTLRRQVTHSSAAWSELFLDGSTDRYTLPSNTAMTFSVLIVGSTTGLGKTFSFKIEGAIENDGGTTALLGTPTVTTIYDADDTSFDVRATADNTNDALLIEVSDSDGAGDTVRWVASLRAVELKYN